VLIVALVAAHVLLVRKHGIVPPFTLDERMGILAAAASDGAAAPAAVAEVERPAAAEAADVPDGQPEPGTEAPTPARDEAEPTG
jgi:hypothetical protein